MKKVTKIHKLVKKRQKLFKKSQKSYKLVKKSQKLALKRNKKLRLGDKKSPTIEKRQKKICKFKWKKRHNIMKKDKKKKVDSVDEKGQTSKKGGTLVKKG